MPYSIPSICLTVVVGLFLSRYSRPLISLLLKKLSLLLPEDSREAFLNQSRLPWSLLILWLVCYLGFSLVLIDPRWGVFLYSPLKVILAYSLILLCWQLLDIGEDFLARNMSGDLAGSFTRHFLPYSVKILKVLVGLVAVLLFLQNSGLNVTSLLAGLGIGGVAIALAAKETLGNFFGGFTVIADKPFSVGDWIVCNEVEGTVQDIGFRSTKVKTFYDSLLTIPNAIISDSIVDNLGKRQSRRTRITLDVTYDTPGEKIKAFVEGIRKIIQSHPQTRKDYYQCYFSGYGPHSLQILLNFFLKVGDWDSELKAKQEIFLEILDLSQKLKVDFAFPTQTLDLSKISPEQKKPFLTS